MKQINTVSLIGLGALGCIYLDRISRALPPAGIRVIASGERAARYRENGVVVNGRTCRFPVVEPVDKVVPADLLIFTVKHHHLAQAIEDVRAHVGPETVIISLLNGISSEEEIAAVYGREKLLYSLSLGIDATRCGDSTTYSTIGQIVFGEARNTPGRYSDKVQRIGEFLARADIPHSIPDDMIASLWNKFMINVGTNQLSAVLRAPYFAFQRVESVRRISLEAMREVVAVATARGITLPDSAPDDALTVLAGMSPAGKTSMLQDIEAGRKTEVEIFGEAVAELGRRYGVPVPINEMMAHLIHAQEEMARYAGSL